jgi:hypothetical protein
MKKMALQTFLYYPQSVQGDASPVILQPERLPKMKLAVRIFALSVIFAGVAAASVSSSTTQALVSSQSATARMPVPLCAPGLPTCPNVATTR